MLFNEKRWFRSLVVVSFSFFILHFSFFTSPLRGCPICFPIPVKTAADYLLEGETVVFAREHPDKPFSFKVNRILKGQTESTFIDQFVNSTIRRTLDSDEQLVVVLARNKQNDSWRNLGIADNTYQQVVERIVSLEREWKGKDGIHKRYQFFVNLFDHENRAIFELAYLELGRAPYSMIKQFSRVIPIDTVRPFLSRREYIEWRPLAILLLAQSDDEQDHQLIEKSFRSCRKFGLSTNLDAWAAAYVEIHGEDAVKEIEATWLDDSDRPETEVRAVVKALSVHGRNGHVHLRDRIVSSYRVALKAHPKVAGPVASDLLEWKKWHFKQQLEDLTKQDISLATDDAKLINNTLSKRKKPMPDSQLR